MQQLDILLARLNRAIDEHNDDLAKAVESGEVTAKDAEQFKVQSGSATFEMVWKESQPLQFTKAVGECMTKEHPQEIVRLSKCVKEPTRITQQFGFGAARAKGTAPVMVSTLQLAHLVARAEPSAMNAVAG